MRTSCIYTFETGRAEGSTNLVHLLGAKGAGLAEMARQGICVPPGFTITTEVCRQYLESGNLPAELLPAVRQQLRHVELLTGRRFGDPRNPLLLSVRSGGPQFMPGMMETILYVGLNEETKQGLPHALAEDCMQRLRKKAGWHFPGEPQAQLEQAIRLVFCSWEAERCTTYRRLHRIPDAAGTACTVQAMVFGNLDTQAGAGVAFTRDPVTGEPRLSGEFLFGLPGEELADGTSTPVSFMDMAQTLPDAYAQLQQTGTKLERLFRDMVEIEFTVENGKLWVLQAMVGQRATTAALRIAVDMAEEGLISQVEAIQRLEPEALSKLCCKQVDDPGAVAVAMGIPAAPGAVCGQVIFRAEEVDDYGSPLLVRYNPNADDIGTIDRLVGLLTVKGGAGAHFSVVARNRGVPAVVGCEALQLHADAVSIHGNELRKGDWLSIDGSTGQVFIGRVTLTEGAPSRHFDTFLSWCDQQRTLSIRAFTDSAEEVRQARALGVPVAISTERMFTGENLHLMQDAILGDMDTQHHQALAELMRHQRQQYSDIFRLANGLPVVLRLLDPPLHEFLPEAHQLPKGDPRRARIQQLRQNNPLLGHRGCRLVATHPHLYRLQVQAIFEAALGVQRQGISVCPHILVPLITTAAEFRSVRQLIDCIAHETLATEGAVPYAVGAMIETPRAALTSKEVATHADFFAVGLMDLTQCVYGASRDDVGAFSCYYQSHQLWPSDPFRVIDQEGVGRLIAIACEEARQQKPALPIEITAWDTASIHFIQRLSPRHGGIVCPLPLLPLVRLAAAQAALAPAP
jgi:pyruvate, orthophosphate dikinase